MHAPAPCRQAHKGMRAPELNKPASAKQVLEGSQFQVRDTAGLLCQAARQLEYGPPDTSRSHNHMAHAQDV